jgi:hypothetical protein
MTSSTATNHTADQENLAGSRVGATSAGDVADLVPPLGLSALQYPSIGSTP